MRSITIIKDSDGKIKVAQFGNYRQCEWSDEPVKSSSEIIGEFKDYFVSFMSNKHKVKKLKENIQYLSFYTTKDSGDFYKIFMSQKKSDIDYCNKWHEDTIGIHILDSIIDGKPEGVRLHDYSSRVSDFMFADIVFEIDFQKHFAEMRIRGRAYERIDLESNTLKSIEDKIVKEVKKSVSRKDESKPDGSSEETGQGWRVGLW